MAGPLVEELTAKPRASLFVLQDRAPQVLLRAVGKAGYHLPRNSARSLAFTVAQSSSLSSPRSSPAMRESRRPPTPGRAACPEGAPARAATTRRGVTAPCTKHNSIPSSRQPHNWSLHPTIAGLPRVEVRSTPVGDHSDAALARVCNAARSGISWSRRSLLKASIVIRRHHGASAPIGSTRPPPRSFRRAEPSRNSDAPRGRSRA